MSTTPQPLARESVFAAHDLIKPYIRLTPVRTSTYISTLASTGGPRITLYFKLEPLQKTGSFKIRGATHALLRISPPPKHVTTHSSGNHAAALALAARRLNIPATIVMPSISTVSKISATRRNGAEVVFSGSTQPEREAKVAEVMQGKQQCTLVPPFDHEDIICGQGTAALELLQQVPDGLDVAITPCGGGGLLAGTALACHNTGVLVYGAEPAGADDCVRGLKARKREETVDARTIADGLRTPVGVRNWNVISDTTKVVGVYSAEEAEILQAMRLVVERMKVLVEPSAVVPLAVVLNNKEWREDMKRRFEGKEEIRVGVVLSGGNTTIEKIRELFSQT